MSAPDAAQDDTTLEPDTNDTTDTGRATTARTSLQVHGGVNATGNSTAIGNLVGNVHYHQPSPRVAWPVRVGIPDAPADHYQERQAHAALVETLTAGRAVVVVGVPPRAGVVVSGLGGVGKTQLAARHAWQTWPDTSVDVAVWVSALSRDAVVTAYADAAVRVLVEQDPRIADRSSDEAAGLFREWLAATSRRWLVVLDDVQDPGDLRGLEPPASQGGQVVITSRLRDRALARGGHRVIELDVFTRGEAVAYLAEALAGTTDVAHRGQLESLAAELGWLPLALGQAAAYIVDQPLLTVAGYRTMLADRRRTLSELTPPEHSLPEHQLTVAATWSLSIERADRADDAARSKGAGLARPLLELAALLDANGTPLAVFTGQPVLDHLTALTGREIAATDVHEGLSRLHRFHLIRLTPDRPARAVAVHALVQRAVRDTLAPDRLHALAHTTADALNTAWPTIDTRDPELAQALRSGTDTLHANTTPSLLNPGLNAVLSRAGESIGDTGRFHAALTYWHALHDQARTHLGPDHPGTLTTRANVAFWRGRAGDPAGAAAEFQVSLADYLRVLGPDHLDTLTTRGNLARSLGEAGDLAGAVAQLEVLLADRLRVLGPDHADTLRTRNNLAYFRREAGDPAGAAAEFEVVLADRLRVLGPDHPDTLETRNNLAYMRHEVGDPMGATAEFEVLLADYLRVLGPHHPNTLTIRNNLAHWRGEAGDQAGAVAELEVLLADRLRVQGPDHPETLTARHDIAYWRGRAGDQARAVAELEVLLADNLRVLGPDHPNTLTSRSNLARSRGSAGDMAGAAAEFELLLADRLRVQGPDHPETLKTRSDLAYCRHEVGDLAGAVADLEGLLVDCLRVMGPDHPGTSTTRNRLAEWRRAVEQQGTDTGT
ncbi:tetratricopeptide repeat protein [Actinosynnema sp. NPDC050801]|uniref:tetratricopeptide repeat protein n=1 Tax=unclassified Actinosynnema TaxID=2637065 RepID=UPI0033FAAF7D